MAAPSTQILKKNYRCASSLQQFYSGGPFAVSSNGDFIACACNDEIKLVSSLDAVVRSTLEGDEETVTALTLSPDDKFLFSSSHSRLIRVWDLETFKCIRSWKGHDGPVMRMTCHASGGLLATAGADKKVCVWDIDGGFCTHFFRGHQGVVTSIKFHPDPKRLIMFSGSDDTSVRVWSLESKKCIAVLEKHFASVTSLSLSEDGQTLLSAGRDQVVNLWDLHTYSFRMTILVKEMVESVSVIHPSTPISSCLGLCNLLTEKRNKSVPPAIYFLTVGERGIISIRSSEGGTCIYKQRASDASHSSDKDDAERGFTSAVILPSDQGLLCVTADQQFIFYRPVKSLGGAFQLNLYKRLIGYNEEILDMKFLGEDEQYLAVATNLEQVRVYDIESMSCSYILEGHREIVVCLDSCISSSGRTLVVSGSKDNSRLSSPTSYLWKHSQFMNASFQRYGFSSTASPESNDKESNKSSDDKKTNGDSAVPDQTEDTDIEPDLSVDDLVKLVEEKEELLKLKHKEIEKMQDKVLRSYAEMENVLDRTRREAENSKKFAIQNFAKNLLDVADNLGRASSVVKDSFSKIDASKDAAGAVPLLKTLLEGVEMTEKQLTEVFRKFGVEKFDPTNEHFDPHRHHAVFQIPDASKPAGTVAAVLKPGYMLYDRVLRPAEVGVTEALNSEADQSPESS